MLSHSDSLASLAPALAQVQAEVGPVRKGKVNPAFKSKYADMNAVLEAIGDVLATNGFSYSQHPGYIEGAEAGIVTVTTLLLHKSGEWLKSEAAAPLERFTAQGVGSAITYLRRYALTSIIGLGQEDDDAQEASRPNYETTLTHSSPNTRLSGPPPPASGPPARSMRDALNEAAEQAGVSREDILAFTDDPFLWLREHQYAYATLVAAARSAREARSEQGALT